MLTIHHLGVSQSDRIVWLAEELGLAYELKRYERDPQTRMAPAEYRALHPAGTAPVITDGDVTLAESGAIVEYLIEKYGQGRLKLTLSDSAYPDYLFWFHYAGASFMPRGMMEMVALRTGGPEAAVMLGQRSAASWTMAEVQLGKGPYLAGQAFTAADIMLVFALSTMRMFVPRDISGYPNIRAYLQRIGDRPAYRAAMAKADPDLPLQLG
jgi:glutathione S-transferase